MRFNLFYRNKQTNWIFNAKKTKTISIANKKVFVNIYMKN